MGNKIRTRILLGRGERGIQMLLHIPRSNIYRAWVLLTRGCSCQTFSWICNPWFSRETCAHLPFQEPQTKLWLFDTLVTPTLRYGVETWGRSLNKANHWKDLVSMIVCMIRSKASVPHDIIRAELGASPIIIEALFRSVTCIQRLWELPKRRYPRLALMSSRQLGENGDIHCWYAEMQQ